MKYPILLIADAPAGGAAAPAADAAPETKPAPDKETLKTIKKLTGQVDGHVKTIAELQDEIARLQLELETAGGKIATYEAANAERSADELQIAKKMALGLSRDQAIAVIKRQKEHDAAEALRGDQAGKSLVSKGKTDRL